MEASDVERAVCTFCDEKLDTAEERRQHEIQDHPMSHVEELEQLLETFRESADKARDVKHERDRLERQVDRLRDEQLKMGELLDSLREARDRLQDRAQETTDEMHRQYHAVTDTGPSADEVELVDIDEPEAEDEPVIRPVDEESLDDLNVDGVDLEDQERLTELNAEKQHLEATVNETDRAIKRLQHRE